MKKLFLGISLILAAVAFSARAADSEIISGNGKTKFETVGEWFAAAKPVVYEDLRAFYAGRCFGVKTADKAGATLLGYYEKNSGDDPGPGFPRPEGVKLVVTAGAVEKGAPADTFDSDQRHPEDKWELLQLAKAGAKYFSKISETPTYNYIYDWENNGRPDEALTFAMAPNGYIVLQRKALLKQAYGDQGVLNPGDVTHYCYYFKKFADVKPRPPVSTNPAPANPFPPSYPPIGGGCQYTCYLEYRDCLSSGQSSARCSVVKRLCEIKCRDH